jgi:hypothetical protein
MIAPYEKQLIRSEDGRVKTAPNKKKENMTVKVYTGKFLLNS